MSFPSPYDWDVTLRLIIAAFLGGLIGFERESHGKEAGVRTYALVSLGSALMMVISLQMYFTYQGNTDPGRLAAQVISGIGFLGAGAIIRFERGGVQEKISGLTTAAGIWTASGIGLACGLGMYHPAIITTIFCLVILIVFSKLNKYFGGKDN